jgi:LuxR family transcriptional regulator, maltose regulon positive regulatory protein
MSAATGYRTARSRLQPPRLPADALPRRELVGRLRQAASCSRLSLVVAGTGYGKSSLLASCAGRRGQVAWLTLDASDRDPVGLLSAIAAAVEVVPHVELPIVEEVVSEPATLLLPKQERCRRLSTALTNDLADHELTLFLDDLHLLGEEAATVLAELIERLPVGVRLVASSRERPALPLGRLRAAGGLFELDGADLALTEQETAALLERATGQVFDAGISAAVHDHTEGWPAAVRLVASVLDEVPDPRGQQQLVARLARADTLVFELVAEELYARQPTDVRAFLDATCVLATLSAEGCRALSGRDDAGWMLEELHRRGVLFGRIEHDGRLIYRYHILVRRFLADRLDRTEPGRLAQLHARAAEVETEPHRVVEHLAAAGADEAVAATLAGVGHDLVVHGHGNSVRRWLAGLPRELRTADPALMYVEGLCLWERQEVAAARQRFARAVELEAHTGGERPTTAMALALLSDCAFMQGDLDAVAASVDQALGLPIPDALRVYLLLESQRLPHFGGDVELADARLLEVMDLIAQCPSREVVAAAAYGLWPGVAALPHGLDALERFCRIAADVAPKAGPANAAVDLLTGAVAFFRGDLDGVGAVDRAAASWGRVGGAPPLLELSYLYLQLHRAVASDDAVAQQRWAAALASRVGSAALPQLQASAGLLQARVAWLRGDVSELRRQYSRIAALPGLEGTLGVVNRQIVAGMLAALAEDRPAALTALSAAVEAEDASPRMNIFGSARVCLAWWHASVGCDAQVLHAGLPALDQIARTRAPGRLLLEGRTAVPLLRAAHRQGLHPELTGTMLEILAPPRTGRPLRVPATGMTLTAREVDVLRVLMTGASNRSIARRLHVGEQTVKSHVANILRKLGATGRTAAVNEARSLGLEPALDIRGPSDPRPPEGH